MMRTCRVPVACTYPTLARAWGDFVVCDLCLNFDHFYIVLFFAAKQTYCIVSTCEWMSQGVWKFCHLWPMPQFWWLLYSAIPRCQANLLHCIHVWMNESGCVEILSSAPQWKHSKPNFWPGACVNICVSGISWASLFHSQWKRANQHGCCDEQESEAKKVLQ